MNPDLFSDPRLVLRSVTLHGRVTHPLCWNSFPGSVIHGVLGFRLKRQVCVREDGDCDTCSLVQQCPYSLFLETRPPEETERMRKYTRVPSPLRVIAEPWDRKVLEPGEDLAITFTIVGRGVEQVIPVLMVLVIAGEKGLGRRDREGRRGTVEIRELEDPVSGKRVPWDPAWYEKGLPFKPVAWSELLHDQPLDTIRFKSPVRIQSQGRIAGKFSFRDLFSSLSRRLSNLAYFHSGVTLDADFKTLLKRAAAIDPPRELHSINQERYSDRQKTRMRLHGSLGWIDISQIPAEFLPWIKLGRYLGVGKGTTMGFGAY